MLGRFRKGRANVLIWTLMAMLVVGLGGWGIGVGGGLTTRHVASVGDRQVTADDYLRALQQELRALSQQVGRDMPMAEARGYGVDRMVLLRLINDAALDEEAARLGLSAGDDAVRAQVMATPGFQGADGEFSRDAYDFALERIGMRPAEFEELLRLEAARELVAGGVQAAATMPATAARTVLDFLGEKRGFEWIRLDAGLLPAPIAPPTDAELEAEHQAHPDRYTKPETRRITTASVTPEALAATIEVPEAELRAAYDAAADTYRTPERRVADRIGFGSAAEAAAAKARLDAGEIDFDALAAERGLKPADIDQGFVTADELSAEARDAVFGAAQPGIVGPVETPLGPSLYRVNAILAAATTPFAEARAELAAERARAEAERRIHEDTAHVEDLLAGGATAEEIAAETVLELGTLALDARTKGGLADDPAFREAALAAETGVETDLVTLEGGGLATLRVDAVEPPALLPLAEVRDRVAADWTAARTAEALTELAEGHVAELEGGLTLAALGGRLGRPVAAVPPLTRGETAEGVPPALVAEVFAAEPGGAVVLRDGDGVILARLGAVEPFDPDAAENAAAVAEAERQFDRQVADDVLTLFTAAVRDEAGVSVNQPLLELDARPLPVMQLFPEIDCFAAGFAAGRNQVVWTRLVADLDTPVSLMLKLTEARKDSFLLESVTGGEVRGRYSIMGMKPDLVWECRGTCARINRSARFDPEAWADAGTDPLASLRALIADSRIELPPDLPPMAAGLFGYLGYDMVRLVERLPHVNPDPLGLPDALLLRPSVVLVVDGVKGEVTVVSPAWAGSGLSARAAYAQAAERVMDAVRDLDRTPAAVRDATPSAAAEPVSNTSRAEYVAIVEKAKEYIRAGDIFQVVPSQRWAQRFELPPFALYRALRRTNPSPYMFYFNFGGFQVIGASPEILVRVKGGTVTVRPIAGTRPRGATPAEDAALEAELLADPKERAEHLMLLDLGRNDVGRVARIGSVDPNEQFVIERYSHVMHIVSNVDGALADGQDALSALLAGLPAGTVSGAPKVRAMQIIDELESEKRGVYGGGVGYFAAGGDMDICIALRTAVVKDGTLYVQAGGGVVYDSDGDAEYEESVNKAKALRQAARDAALFLGARGGN